MADLRKLTKGIVFVDVETTGLQADDRIVSVGAYHLDLVSLDARRIAFKPLHLICNPKRPSHPMARRAHGYDDRLLGFQDLFAEHAAAIWSFIHAADLVVAHNAAFDLRFLNSEFGRAGLRQIGVPSFCTMEHERQREPGRGASLAATCARLGLRRADGRHDALEDAWLAMMIFLWRQRVPVHDGRFAFEGFSPTNMRAEARRRGLASTVNERDGATALLDPPEPPLRPIPGHTMHAPDEEPEEDEEGEEWADLDELSIGIVYAGANGIPSERVIRCSSSRRVGTVVHIGGWCQLRGAYRTFRLDRIQAVIDYDTGEVIDDVAGFFAAYLPPAWLAVDGAVATPDVAGAIELFADGARVLLYLAMSDGSLHETEFAIIHRYALDRMAAGGFDGPVCAAMAVRWIRNHVPTSRSAKLALNRLIDDPARGAEIAHLVSDLIAADGAVTDSEMSAALALTAAIRKREAAGLARPHSPRP